MKAEGSLKASKTEAQTVTIDLDTKTSDVGDVAKAIANCKTPHADKVAPAAALVVSIKGVTKEDTEKVSKALADVKGVIAKESTAGQGEVVISLDQAGGAKLAEISKALKKVTD